MPGVSRAGSYDFDYTFPEDFDNRVIQLLHQYSRDDRLAEAFARCTYEYDDVGNAYRAGIKGDNWNMNALDFTIEGSRQYISIVRENINAVRKAIEKALRPSKSGFQLRDIDWLETDANVTSFATNDERLNADIVSAESVLLDIVKVGESLSTNAAYTRDCSEDTINDYIRDVLRHRGYGEMRDQTRHGLSGSEKGAGEVDLLLSKGGEEVALIEAMKLDCIDSTTIDAHIIKATTNYNPLGTPTFVLLYVCSDDFGCFWERFVSYLEQYDFRLDVKQRFEARTHPNAATRIGRTVLARDGYSFPVYFIAVKLIA